MAAISRDGARSESAGMNFADDGFNLLKLTNQ
jgi:hypothetical protein